MKRLITSVVVYFCAAWLLCDIEPDKTYTWYSGIWHGMFFIVNIIRSMFTDALFKATDYTTAYNVFYWISAIFASPIVYESMIGKEIGAIIKSSEDK